MCEYYDVFFKVTSYEIDRREKTIAFCLSLCLNMKHPWNSITINNRDFPRNKRFFRLVPHKAIANCSQLYYLFSIDFLHIADNRSNDFHFEYEFINSSLHTNYCEKLKGEFIFKLANDGIATQHDLTKIVYSKKLVHRPPPPQKLSFSPSLVVEKMPDDCWRSLNSKPLRWEELSDMHNMRPNNERNLHSLTHKLNECSIDQTDTGYRSLCQATDNMLPTLVND